MTKISFYILGDASLEARQSFAVKFVRQAWRKGFDVHCHVSAPDQAAELDQLLWADNESFIPHDLQTSGEAISKNEVGIGWHEPSDRSGILVNLGKVLPEWFAHFDNLVEIVVQENSVLEATRETWKYLKFNGYPITKHDLRS